MTNSPMFSIIEGLRIYEETIDPKMDCQKSNNYLIEKK